MDDEEPWTFEADSSNAERSALLTILRSVTATVADLPGERYRFKIEIEEVDADE